MSPTRLIAFFVSSVLSGSTAAPLALLGHEEKPVTHRFDGAVTIEGPELELSIVDAETGRSVAARVSLRIDDKAFVPDAFEGGIRFTSIHLSKGQRFATLYARGEGPLVIGLPQGARSIAVTAVRGFQYRPAQATIRPDGARSKLELRLEPWIDLAKAGWIAVDEHVHFDRLDPKDDTNWLRMLDADGLSAAHFLVLKGGMTPGIWSRQFAYGAEGRTSDGTRSLIPGQEYRDSAQGHINLLGIESPIEPYSTGGMGWPAIVENAPPLHDVLVMARSRGGLVGVAHGGSLGRHSTAVADAILGAMDFWEISNGFIYEVDTWYRLMNCGIFLPPIAGTDLPNWPERETWQPFLGSIRTYVHTGGRHDFASFRSSMQQGRVFISGGPMIDLWVNGKTMGETVHLPKDGGDIRLRAELRSIRPPQEFRIVRDGQVMDAEWKSMSEENLHHWVIEKQLRVDKSLWVAAWGRGETIPSQRDIDVMAHTNAIRIQVGDQPFRSSEEATGFIQQLKKDRTFYSEKAIYKNEEERHRALQLYDQAIARLGELKE